MPEANVSLPDICQKAGVSRQTAYRILEGHNPLRAPFGHHRFSPEEVPRVVALIQSKRKRKCLNRFNAVPMEASL